MKPLLWVGIISASGFGLRIPPTEARVGMESAFVKGAGAAQQARMSGVIGQIDLGSGTMQIGGVKYLYSPSMTRVFRKSGKSVQETLSPLSLHASLPIEFLTKKEGAKERITDIWLTGGKL